MKWAIFWILSHWTDGRLIIFIHLVLVGMTSCNPQLFGRGTEEICPQEWPAGQWFITGTKRLGASKTAVHIHGAGPNIWMSFVENQKLKGLFYKVLLLTASYIMWLERTGLGRGSGTFNINTQGKGPPASIFAFTETYVCQDGQWMLFARHAAKLWGKLYGKNGCLSLVGRHWIYNRPFAPRKTVEWSYEGLCQTQKGQGAGATRKISAKSHCSSIINVVRAGFPHHIFGQGSEAIVYWLTAGNQFLAMAQTHEVSGYRNILGLSPWMHQDTALTPSTLFNVKEYARSHCCCSTHPQLPHRDRSLYWRLCNSAWPRRCTKHQQALHYIKLFRWLRLLCSSSWKIFHHWLVQYIRSKTLTFSQTFMAKP